MNIDIRYFYQNNKRNVQIETIITKLVDNVSKHIELPDTLEFCIYKFDENVYGGIDKHIPHRIGLNSSLSLEEIPQILVHELLHVHQRHTGSLAIRNSTYYWLGIPYHNTETNLSYQEYKSTPWEIDVENRAEKLLTLALQN